MPLFTAKRILLACSLALVPLAFSALPKAPEGFVVEKAAGPPQIQFPMFAAFDERGRLFVSESSGGDLYEELSKLTRRCRISMLEDRDGDGRFERSVVFAADLVFPMGVAVKGGKVYAPDGPDIIALEDGDRDGRADRREIILSGFGHSDNGGAHGPFLGPDGWLYITVGQPDGYRFRGSDGREVWSKAGALIRCKPDGSEPEVVARGFENLVEIIFLPTWEMIGSLNWYQLPANGVRDALVHLVEGAKYPRMPDDGSPKPFTGRDLPAAALFPPVAISGIAFYDGQAFPAEMSGNIFSAQHNTRAVQRHTLRRSGATFEIHSADFLTSVDPDFHPSDMLVAPDGSLLVVDTGGWYVQHCPTGKIRASGAPGGIYRVRYSGQGAQEPLAMSEEEKSLVELRKLARERNAANASKFVEALGHTSAATRLAAAEGLAGCGRAEHAEAVLSALTRETLDAFEEHALIHALHWIAGEASLKAALKRAHPRIQRAALILLDQPPRKGLSAEVLLPLLHSSDAPLREAAMDAFKRHPEWAALGAEFLRELAASDSERFRSIFLGLQTEPAAQDALARAIQDKNLDASRRALLVEIIGQTSLAKLPALWVEALRAALRSGNATLQIAVARASATQQDSALAAELSRVAREENHSPELRLEALRASLQRGARLEDGAFEFLVGRLGREVFPPTRLAAAETIRRAKLSERQSAEFQKAIEKDPLFSRNAPSRDAEATLRELEPLLEGGDARRGRELFLSPRTACAACHRIGSEGGIVGPDLTKIGLIRSGRDLLEAIAVPSSTFAQGFETWAVTVEEETVSGTVARQDEHAVFLRDASGSERRIARSQIARMERSEVSLMPEGVDEGLAKEEFRDLLAFLQSLR